MWCPLFWLVSTSLYQPSFSVHESYHIWSSCQWNISSHVLRLRAKLQCSDCIQIANFHLSFHGSRGFYSAWPNQLFYFSINVYPCIVTWISSQTHCLICSCSKKRWHIFFCVVCLFNTARSLKPRLLIIDFDWPKSKQGFCVNNSVSKNQNKAWCKINSFSN